MMLLSCALKGTPMTSLQQKLNQLNLTTMSQQLDETLADAASKNLSAAEAFEALLEGEVVARHTRASEGGLLVARLQSEQSIDSVYYKKGSGRLQGKRR